MALALNNLKKGWYAIKQRNQTKPNQTDTEYDFAITKWRVKVVINFICILLYICLDKIIRPL